MSIAEQQIAAVLERWAEATREDRKDDMLSSHADDAVIFDVLPPLRYDGTQAYGILGPSGSRPSRFRQSSSCKTCGFSPEKPMPFATR